VSAALPAPSAAELAAFVDREAIREELAAYFEALGRRDWERVAAGFAPGASLDYGTPGVRDLEGNLRLLRAGVERLSAASSLLGMQARVWTRGDAASSETAAFTAHLAADAEPARLRVSCVRYADAWLRSPDGRWRVRERVVRADVKGWLDAVREPV